MAKVTKIVGSKTLSLAHIILADGNTQAANVTDPRGWAQLVEGAENGSLADYFGMFEADPEDELAAQLAGADDWATVYEAA